MISKKIWIHSRECTLTVFETPTYRSHKDATHQGMSLVYGTRTYDRAVLYALCV
jgi:hypothetical protein